jgi:hypothetical protein
MTNDEIRDLILRHLYESHRGDRGRSGGAQPIRDLQSAMRPHGLKQQDVGHNLDYLVQKGWVREVVTERKFTTPRGTTQSSEKVSYKISDTGIDRIEVASTYRRTPAGSINVTNIQGVTVVGNDNIVNTTFTDLSRALSDARQVVLDSRELAETDKLNIVADIDSLQSQLQKPAPSREVIGRIWSGLENVLNTAGLVELGVRIGALIQPLIS